MHLEPGSQMKAKAKSAAQTGRTGQRQWLVMKFGGSSVSSARCWELIREQAERVIDSGQFGMIVVSALSGVTNLLSCMAEEAVAERRSALLEDIKQRHDNLLQQLDVGVSPEYEHHWRDLAKMNGQETFPLVPDQRAVLLSFGELLSSALGKQVLEQAGLPVVLQDARELLQAAQADVDTRWAMYEYLASRSFSPTNGTGEEA